MSQSIPEVPATLSESDEARQDMPKSEKLNRECGRWDSCAFSLILLIFNTNRNILFTIFPIFHFLHIHHLRYHLYHLYYLPYFITLRFDFKDGYKYSGEVDGDEMMAHGHGVLIGPCGTYAGLWHQGMQTVGVYTWYIGAKYEVNK